MEQIVEKLVNKAEVKDFSELRATAFLDQLKVEGLLELIEAGPRKEDPR